MEGRTDGRLTNDRRYRIHAITGVSTKKSNTTQHNSRAPTPNTIKKTVVGVGHAAKAQINHMVRLQLPGVIIAGPDAADALAIALCHAYHTRSAGKLSAAIARSTA